MKKEIYVNDDEINIIFPTNTTLCYSFSDYPEAEKIVLVGCKREPRVVKTDEGWEVLL